MSQPQLDPSEFLARARRSWSPEPGAAERVRRGLDAKLLAAPGVIAAGAGVTAWPSRLLLAGAFAVAAGGVGYWAGYRAGRRAAPAPRPAAVMAAPVLPAAPAVAPVAVTLPGHAAVEAPSFVPRRRETSAARHGADSHPAPRDGALAVELRALRNAERALREGRPGLARAFLNELDRQVPHGELTEERDATATLARCAERDHPFGVNLAEDFVTRYPTSVYRARVEQVCAATDSPAPGDKGARRSE